MNIFISGATGYIGNHLAKRLASEGHTIHALCRSPQEARNVLQNPCIQLFEGEITDIVAVERAMKGCEQVYHLAAFAKVWAPDKTIYHQINVAATENILKVAQKCGISKCVYTSTAGVFGPSNGRPIREDDERAGRPFNEYEVSKIAAEKLCSYYVLHHAMNIVIVNPPRVYGHGILSESNAVTRLIKRYINNRWKIIPGNGDRTGSYVYIDDVVNGHILAMQKGRSGERYLLSGCNESYNSFFDTLAEVAGMKVTLYNMPVWAMLLAGHAMVLRARITGKPPLLTPDWIKKYYYDWSFDCSKAIRELGYSYISLDEGLMKTVEDIQRKKLKVNN